MNSPHYAPAGVLVEFTGHRVMIDGVPSAEPDGKLDAWLVTDEPGELMRAIRKLARLKALEPEAARYSSDDLLIEPHRAKDVKTKSLGVFGKSVSIDDVITLSKGSIANNTFATVTFERDGAFEIKSWEWRVNGVSTGTHLGPPEDTPPGATGAKPAGGGDGAADGP